MCIAIRIYTRSYRALCRTYAIVQETFMLPHFFLIINMAIRYVYSSTRTGVLGQGTPVNKVLETY